MAKSHALFLPVTQYAPSSAADFLIHVGIDTVKMDGNGFTKKVSDGAKVHAGDVLIEADLNAIKEAAYPTPAMDPYHPDCMTL